MSECAICDHAKIAAITEALARKKLPSVVRANYRLDKDAWDKHLHHLSECHELNGVVETAPEPLHPAPGYSPDESVWTEPSSEQPIDILNVGLPYVRKSFRLAGTDEEEQQRLLQILNDAIASERMGL